MDSTSLLENLNKSVYSNLNSSESLYFRKQQIEIEKELSPLDNGEIKDLLKFWSFIDLFNSIKAVMHKDFVSLADLEHPEYHLGKLMIYLAEYKADGKVNQTLFEPIVYQLQKLNNILLFAHYFTMFVVHSEKTKPKSLLIRSLFKTD